MTRQSIEDIGCGVIGLAAVAGFVLICGLGLQFLMSLGMPAAIAEIEQLRADSAHVDPAQAEDVVGQVTQWNQSIRANQALNDTWYIGWAIPDEWDAIETIPVPR